MTENRFTLHKGLDTLNIMDNTKFNEHIYINKSSKDMKLLVGVLNELHEENMNLRAKHTQMIIILKDVVNDLKRMDTYRYAEHLEKIANLHFLSEKELKE